MPQRWRRETGIEEGGRGRRGEMLSEQRRTNVRVKRGQFATAAREIASVFRLIRECARARAQERERERERERESVPLTVHFRVPRSGLSQNFQVKNNSPLDTESLLRRPIPSIHSFGVDSIRFAKTKCTVHT